MPRPAGWGLPGARGNEPARIGASARARVRARAGVAFAAATIVGVGAACRGKDAPTETPLVKTVVVTLDFAQITVGATARATAYLLDAGGKVLPEREVLWTNLTPTIITVSTFGDIIGLQPGTGLVRASSGSVGTTVSIVVKNQLASTIRLARDTATLTLPNGAVQAIPVVTDEFGQPLVNPNIVWTSSRPLVASVNVAGLVTGVASGSAIITGSIDDLTASLSVTVRPAATAAAPTITSFTPPVLRPGGAFTITGTNFGATPGANQALINGMPVTVQAASTTQLSIVLPTLGFGCEPAYTGFLQIRANGEVGGGAVPLQIGVRRALAAGQSVIVTDAAEVRCNELVPAAGRWVVSIYNATRAAVVPSQQAGVQFSIRGLTSPPTLAQQRVPASIGTPLALVIPHAALTQARPRQSFETARAVVHADMLERNLAALRASPHRVPAASSRLDGAPRTQVTTAGTITTIRLPNLDAPDFCVSHIPIGARTVFVGAHSVILEDTIGTLNARATLKGQMDDYFARLGNEFETVMWPILTASFGNPLAMDALLGGPGKVVMVFSPRVNAMQRGEVVGFVTNCDLFPVKEKPSSNVGAFFYANTPTSTAAGYANAETRDQWLRVMRATVIHEVKHVTAFAERTARGFALEDASWEEGMARIAEELYARTIYAIPARSDATWSQSIACDIRYRAGTPGCADRPILMLRHFDGMYAYMSSPENFSPLGRTFVGEVAFYAGAWSFLRWANDHFAQGESPFFRSFTASNLTGAANVEARTGRPWEESLGEWSLAMYLDDVAGYSPQSPRLKLLSWNLADIWAGMCADLGPCVDPTNPIQVYGRPSPFIPKARTFGNFLIGVGPMVGGGFTLLDLGGPSAPSQVIELKSLLGSADPPATLRLAITRVR